MFSPSQGFSYVFSLILVLISLTSPGPLAWQQHGWWCQLVFFPKAQFLFSVFFSQQSLTALSLWLELSALQLSHSLTPPSKSGSYCLASSETDRWISVWQVRHSRPTLSSPSYACYQRNRLFHSKFISIGNYDQSYHLPCRKGPTPGTLKFFPKIAQMLGFSEDLGVQNNSEGKTEQNIEDLYFVQQLHVYFQLSI